MSHVSIHMMRESIGQKKTNEMVSDSWMNNEQESFVIFNLNLFNESINNLKWWYSFID